MKNAIIFCTNGIKEKENNNISIGQNIKTTRFHPSFHAQEIIPQFHHHPVGILPVINKKKKSLTNEKFECVSNVQL